MTKRFLIRPGHVISPEDGDLHWISARQIMDLNHIDPRECIVIDDRRPDTSLGYTEEYLSTLLELGPMRNIYSPVSLAERRQYPIQR